MISYDVMLYHMIHIISHDVIWYYLYIMSYDIMTYHVISHDDVEFRTGNIGRQDKSPFLPILHIIWYHMISQYIILYHRGIHLSADYNAGLRVQPPSKPLLDDIIWHHMTSHDVTWCHMMSYDTQFCQAITLQRYMFQLRHDHCHMTSADITWYLMISYDVIWHHIHHNNDLWLFLFHQQGGSHDMSYDVIWRQMI